MALVTSPAAAIARSSRWSRSAIAAAVLLSMTAPALAAEQVYIWRDQNGAVWFSSVRDSSYRPAATLASESPAAAECSAQPAIASSNATELAAY